jgi:hypothetical protein
MSAEAHLWRSVLLLGLQDALRGQDTDWIGSPAFDLVCELALLTPEDVAQAFHERRFLVHRAGRKRAA